MKLCLNTDCLGDLPFEAALDVVVEQGIEAIEVAAGGHSNAPHLRLDELLADPAARTRFADAIRVRGLQLNAINCSADPLHPRIGAEHRQMIENSIRLAGELGVDKIVTMSGCPGDSPQARMANWTWFPWPDEARALRKEQWEIALETWSALVELADANGVTRIALELLPLQLVYNVPALLELRKELGPAVGANIDPSHMFWQQIDPVRVVEALGAAVHHVHLKDTELFEDELSLHGVLDCRPWDDPGNRAWMFRTIGHGHPASFWGAFFEALSRVGYVDTLSIENEDVILPGVLGVEAAVKFATPLLEALGQERQPVA